MTTYSFFDDVFDDSSRPSLRIPPLQNPLPETSTLLRPPPLEPNARVNIDNEAEKLTGRRKALAQAKPLDATEPNDWEGVLATKLRGKSENKELGSQQERPIKRAKVADFVRLPKPLSQSKEEKAPTFRPVAVLNQLNEPPPSAALFPPITPNLDQDQNQRWLSLETRNEGGNDRHRKGRFSIRSQSVEKAPKRCLRARKKWTEAESSQLVKGVAIYGMSRWKAILDHPEFTFQEGRTYRDLKDRFRTLFPSKSSKEKPRNDGKENLVQSNSKRLDVDPKKRARAQKRPWSEYEDAQLDKAFRQYGFQWHLMLKDPDLHFNNRNYGQIRDRFRRRYPELYNEQRPDIQDAGAQQAGEKAPTKPVPSIENPVINVKPMSNFIKPRNGDVVSKSNDAPAKPLIPPLTASALNAEGDDNRLPNSILHDDWNLYENLTLAPLAWEDIANQPMFPFD